MGGKPATEAAGIGGELEMKAAANGCRGRVGSEWGGGGGANRRR